MRWYLFSKTSQNWFWIEAGNNCFMRLFYKSNLWLCFIYSTFFHPIGKYTFYLFIGGTVFISEGGFPSLWGWNKVFSPLFCSYKQTVISSRSSVLSNHHAEKSTHVYTTGTITNFVFDGRINAHSSSPVLFLHHCFFMNSTVHEIGRASCRERVSHIV